MERDSISSKKRTEPRSAEFKEEFMANAHANNPQKDLIPSPENSSLEKEKPVLHTVPDIAIEGTPPEEGADLHGLRGGARGTAAMDPATRQEVARKGGLAVSRNKQHMADIGRKGGQSVSKNREHMAKIGRKGGAASRGTRGSEGESELNELGSEESGASNL
jgi:general stress protein YciG